jgi:phosphatidylserine decarboxylase
LNLSRDSLCVQTFNDFFIRELKPGVRPIAYEDIDSVAVCAADSRLMAFNSPDDATRFWIKVPVSFSYLRFHLWLAYIGAHVVIESCRVGYLLLIPRNICTWENCNMVTGTRIGIYIWSRNYKGPVSLFSSPWSIQYLWNLKFRYVILSLQWCGCLLSTSLQKNSGRWN